MVVKAGSGAVDVSDLLSDIDVPALDMPDLSFSPSPLGNKDLFAVKKRAAWKTVQTEEARCDFSPNRMRIYNRGGVFYIALWQKSVYGRTLSDIKSDPDMVDFFSSHISPLIRSVLGSFLSGDDYAIVTTPKRRHKEWNFASLVSAKLAEHLGLPFFEDCALAHSRHRIGAVFSANNIPPHRNLIVFDDFVSTGQTLVSMQNLLREHNKNCVFFAGVSNNKL